MSKLPKPSYSTLRSVQSNVLKGLPGTKDIKGTPRNPSDITLAKTHRPLTDLPQSRLGRRSKSVTDLRPVSSRTVRKRTADGGINEASKPKIKKIPDWDYKGRFYQLQEKYTVLSANFKDSKDKLADFNDIEEKYVLLQKEESNLRKEKDNLQKENKILLQNEQQNLKEIETLGSLYKTLSKDYESLKIEHCNIRTENERLHNENKEASSEINILSKRLECSDIKCNEQQLLIMKLKEELYKSNEERRSLHNNIQDLKGNIRVFCRVRPPINDEITKLQCHLKFIDDITLEIRRYMNVSGNVQTNSVDKNTSAMFTFDKVFAPESSQQEVFEELTQLVQSALDGYNVCVFAYGQTGSGKTYTMQGKSESDNLGMIPRTIDLIFQKIKQLQKLGWQYTVQASFLEIYNENVRDLLNYDSSKKLEIHFNEGRGTTVSNLTIKETNSVEELTSYMVLALKNRATETTHFNEHSSRSHAVTKIYLQGLCKDNNSVYMGSINLVDLAGSESAKTTSNERLTETKNINKSLSTLGDVMLALHNKSKHIPYRNSKLTYLLQSSLGGNSKTLMIVNIAPFEECFSESINSLRFASKVKEVKIGVKKNKTVLLPLTTPRP